MATTNALDGVILPVAQGGTGAGTLTANYVLLGNTTSALQMIAPSTSGNVLTSNGTTWASTAPAGGSELVLLATGTASSSSTIDFTSIISSSYNMYLVVFEKILNSATATIGLVLSTDNGSTWTYNMTGQTWTIGLSSTSAPTYASAANGTTPCILTNSQQLSYSGWINISSNSGSGFIAESFLSRGQGGGTVKTYVTGIDVTTVTAIRFAPSTGNFTSGKIYLYGVKNT